MFLLKIERTYAFFKRQQRLVDFSTVKSRLSVLVDSVCAALTACQINKAHFTKLVVKVAASAKSQLEYSMGTRGVSIGTCLATRTFLESLFHDLHDLLNSLNLHLLYALNLDFLLAILSALKQLSFVQ